MRTICGTIPGVAMGLDPADYDVVVSRVILVWRGGRGVMDVKYNYIISNVHCLLTF